MSLHFRNILFYMHMQENAELFWLIKLFQLHILAFFPNVVVAS